MGDEFDLANVWAVLTRNATTGVWAILSIHMTEEHAMAAQDRESLCVVELELSRVGSQASLFASYAKHVNALAHLDDAAHALMHDPEFTMEDFADARADAKRILRGEEPAEGGST